MLLAVRRPVLRRVVLRIGGTIDIPPPPPADNLIYDERVEKKLVVSVDACIAIVLIG